MGSTIRSSTPPVQSQQLATGWLRWRSWPLADHLAWSWLVPLAILMVDVDHLRAVNTAHGHLAGDRALKNVAEALGRATREYDIAARFGGDEFCVLLPETDLAGAVVVADRIRAFVEMAGDPRVTVSVGVAAQQGVEQTPEDLMGLADRAAYRAKFSGRNSVAVPLEGDAVQEAEQVLLDALGGDAA